VIRGKWTYRSLRNIVDLGADFNSLEFGRGMITFGTVAYDQIYDAELDMGDSYKLTLKGQVLRQNGVVTGIEWRGEGIQATPTQGWIYDYQGTFTRQWPNGVNQAHVIVGSLIRVLAHGSAPPGFVGTVFMVKNP